MNVQRVLHGLPGWCTDKPDRCRQLAQNLQQAVERCRLNPQACPILQERVDALIAEVGDIAALEELKQRCSESGEASCQDFIARCRQHADLCIAPDPPGPVIDRLEDARERLQSLQRLCSQRDTRACRQIAQICASHPTLCPDAPRPPSETRPATTTTPSTQRVAPAATPVSDIRPFR
jgi:hypothetical protein